MSMLYILIPLALMLLAVAAWALIWAIRTGQFDDLESHGWSVVLDDDQKPPPDPEPEPVGGRIAADDADRDKDP
jgi:cbb3-type cytochrome oxidase maturation protein